MDWMDWSEFHFLRPWWFLAMVVPFVLLWFLRKRGLAAHAWQRVCDPALLPHVLLRYGMAGHRGRLWLIGVSSLLIITALAGPVKDRLETSAWNENSGLVVAVDLSHSMESVDIPPNRLTRAGYKILDWLEQYEANQLALIGYAHNAFPIVPLTNDAEAFKFYLNLLSSDLAPKQGSRPEHALRLAADLLKQGEVDQGKILLITDYAGDDETLAEARRLRDAGWQFAVWGVGTEAGAPIPRKAGNFLMDKQGRTVVPRLDEAAMLRLAQAGAGIYLPFDTMGDTDVDVLIQWLDQALPADAKLIEGLRADIWRELGPYLLLLLLPLVLLAFRRGVLTLAIGVPLACLIALHASPASAESASSSTWDALWTNVNQRAHELYQQGDIEGAETLFGDREWQGYLRYQGGNYEGAVHALMGVRTPDGLYNLGNALARAGKYREAMQAYAKALQLAPNMRDAKANMRLVSQLVPMERSSSSDQGEGDESENGEQGEQTGEGEQGEQGEQGDQDEQGEQGEQGDQGEGDESENGEQGEQTGEGEDEEGEQDGESEDSDGNETDDGEQEGEQADDEGDDAESNADDDGEGEGGNGDDGKEMTELEQATENIINQVEEANPRSVLGKKLRYQDAIRKRREKDTSKKQDKVREQW